MASYSSKLKTWGAVGSEYPDSYNYSEGEQPVDAWDNYLTYNLIEDVRHLVSLTNQRIESDSGAEFPSSPDAGHLTHRTDSPDGSGKEELHQYDATNGTWDRLLKASGDTMSGVLDMGGYEIDDSSGSLTFGTAVRGSNDILEIDVGNNRGFRFDDDANGPRVQARENDTLQSEFRYDNGYTGWVIDSNLHVNDHVVINGGTSYHSNNDGPGSNLDADTLDGMQGNELDTSIVSFYKEEAHTVAASDGVNVSYTDFNEFVPTGISMSSDTTNAFAEVTFWFENSGSQTFDIDNGEVRHDEFPGIDGKIITIVEIHLNNQSSYEAQMDASVQGFTLE